MSKIGKNYAKKELKINTDNFGFSFSHYKNKSSNFLSLTQRVETSPYLSTNSKLSSNIHNQFNNNNINIINININSNNTSNCNSTSKKYSNSNQITESSNDEKGQQHFINYLKKNGSKTQRCYEKKIIKLDTNPNNNTSEIKTKKLLKYDSSYSTSRPETESNILKNSYKIQLNKRQDIMPLNTPRQMIISYCDVKNILDKNNLKIEINKKLQIPKSARNQDKKENSNDTNKGKNKIIKKNNSNLNTNLRNIKHQSEENLLKFSNNRLYYSKNIKQSKSFLNKYKLNNLNSNDINSLIYLKTSGNIQKENKKRIKHYFTNNEMNVDKKNNIKDKMSKNFNINYNFHPTPSTSTTNKTQKLSSVYFFQKNFFKINSNKNNNIETSNTSNIRANKTNSNNNINKNSYLAKKNKNNKNHNKADLSNINKKNLKNNSKTLKKEKYSKENISFSKYNTCKTYNNKLKKESLSLEEHFDNEIKINNFKNPEEFHFFYIKVFQAGKEISQNFENESFNV